MTQYYGDFSEDETVYIPFNTFSSDDPSASVTITNLVAGDIKVHKDGSATEIVTDGATIAIDFGGITGNHLITIDTSAHADYATGSDYMVRIEGTTVDAATVNAWVGTFSIENRHSAGALRPTTAGRTLDVTATGAAGIDWGNVENASTAVDLSGTDIQLCDTITTYTGNAVQTGDTYALANGATGFAAIDTVVDSILVDTGTTIPATIATAQADLDTITGADGAALATTQSAITWGAQTISVTGATANLTMAGSGTGDTMAFTRSGSGDLYDTAWAADIDALIDTAISNASLATAASISALQDISTADVLTQVNAALDTAISELGVAAPTATPNMRTGLMLLYMMARNKLVVQTSGTDAIEVYNDAGTKIAAKTITDDGTDYTENEMA